MTTNDKSDYISRSALAERLGIPLKDVTQLMIDPGWIIQEGKAWALTAKGEFEGGIYRQSKKYGQYIVWPVSITEHAAIRDIKDSLLPVSALAKNDNVPARLLNRLLAVRGLIAGFAKGWQITPLGKRFGGVQCQDENSAVPYVIWPRSIQDNSLFRESIKYLGQESSLRSLDGRTFEVAAHSQIANWLYLLGFGYSFRHQHSLDRQFMIESDFYLPSHALFIDYWPASLPPNTLLSQRLFSALVR